jgi:amidohydrolase
MKIEIPGVTVSKEVIGEIDGLVELRRRLHRRPELGNHEQETQRLILEILSEAQIESKPMAQTGVVGIIRGKRPGRVVMLRADMDALEIDEETNVTYRSEVSGVMHACGHDAHIAMLLTAARLIKKRGIDQGAVKLMFQPAEEGGGGAGAMIAAGLLENPKVDASLAFHVWTPFAVGQIAALSGPVAASVDGFRIRILGKGTHAAVPEDGVDPVVIAAQIITMAQSLVTRRISSQDPVVLSFGSIKGGSAFNIIPEEVEITGTFRTFDAAVRDRLRKGLQELVVSVSEAFGGRAEYESFVEHVPVINDPEIAGLARRVAVGVVGEDRVIEPRPLMVGEDIGEVQERVPGALVLLGCGNKEIQADFPHHHPKFNIDERVLPIGVECALRFVDEFFRQ